jgi:hypothetical protein
VGLSRVTNAVARFEWIRVTAGSDHERTPTFLPSLREKRRTRGHSSVGGALCNPAHEKFLIRRDSIEEVSVYQRTGFQRVKAVDII